MLSRVEKGDKSSLFPSFNNQKLAPKEKLAAISLGPIRVPEPRNSTKALIYAGKVIIQNICVHICTITVKDCHYSPVTSVLLIVRIDMSVFCPDKSPLRNFLPQGNLAEDIRAHRPRPVLFAQFRRHHQ